MRLIPIVGMVLCAFTINIATVSAQKAHNEGACGQIFAACRDAGYTPGGGKGSGLQRDCVAPIMVGSAPRKAAKAPPQVDPQVIADCKAQNPQLGQNRAQPGEAAAAEQDPEPPPAIAPVASDAKHPNIVFVLTDDLAVNLVQYMPHVLAMQKAGTNFPNYFVTDSLCCPSRSSIFTGRFPHDTGIFRNTGDDGGFAAFRSRHHERATFATALQAAGYRTAMMGKYLNGYEPKKDPPERGWNLWAVAGNGYPNFNYDLNVDGNVVHHGKAPADFLTDVLSGIATDFIKQSAGKAFMIEIATFSPHAPYTPAPRDADKFPGLMAPRTPAFNIAHQPNEPVWLSKRTPLNPQLIANIDSDFRKRVQAVQAVDKMIGDLEAAVAAAGQEKNTYFVFSSDNGYHMGEYRLMPGKMTAYDTDIKVPLVIKGPGVPAGRSVDDIVENIDLNPTFTELGGGTIPANVDGRSLASFLHGQAQTDWRKVALIEHHGPVKNLTDPDFPEPRSGNPTTYEAIRSPVYLYVEYADGDKEYHDLKNDPEELHNTYAALPSAEKALLHAVLTGVQNCHDAKACLAAENAARNAARN